MNITAFPPVIINPIGMISAIKPPTDIANGINEDAIALLKPKTLPNMSEGTAACKLACRIVLTMATATPFANRRITITV